MLGILLIFLYFLASVMSLNFDLEMKPKEMICFGESLSENTLVIGELRGKLNEFYVRVYDDTGNLLFSKTNETKIVFSFTSNSFIK
jgi:hypothetical protein